MLLTAEWGDVRNDDEAFLRLRNSKTGPREVPLAPAALAVLKGLPRLEGTERIFPMTPNQLKCAWARVLKRAGITGLRIHDLRHESASRYALALGGNPFLLKEITGHKSIKMLERYVNFSRKELMQKLKDTKNPVIASPEPSAPLTDNVVPLDARRAASAIIRRPV
jgi:integrase